MLMNIFEMNHPAVSCWQLGLHRVGNKISQHESEF
jgi:hypothetical protein